MWTLLLVQTAGHSLPLGWVGDAKEAPCFSYSEGQRHCLLFTNWKLTKHRKFKHLERMPVHAGVQSPCTDPCGWRGFSSSFWWGLVSLLGDAAASGLGLCFLACLSPLSTSPQLISFSSGLMRNGKQLGHRLPPRRWLLSSVLLHFPSVACSPLSLPGHPRGRISMKTHYLPAWFCCLSSFLEAGGLSMINTLKKERNKQIFLVCC